MSSAVPSSWRCPYCGHTNLAEATFCVSCGEGGEPEATAGPLPEHDPTGISGREVTAQHTSVPMGSLPPLPDPDAENPTEAIDLEPDIITATTAAVPQDPYIGVQVGRWVIQECVGAGAFGAVYKSKHRQLENNFAAIKILRPELSRDEHFLKRFEIEAQVIGALNHPNIVRAQDFGQLPDGSYFILMEFVRGESLDKRLKRLGAFELREACYIASEIARGLYAAHCEGVIHRDLKPENILVYLPRDENAQGGVYYGHDQIKIIDFGIAKNVSATMADVKLTVPGLQIGTPPYLSPEQCRIDMELDHRTDIYSLGVIMYRMICGDYPIKPDDPSSLRKWIQAHLNMEPPPPRSPHGPLPTRLAETLMRMLEKDRDSRFATMREVQDELHKVLEELDQAQKRPEPPPEGFIINRRWQLGHLMSDEGVGYLHAATDLKDPSRRVLVRVLPPEFSLDREVLWAFDEECQSLVYLSEQAGSLRNVALCYDRGYLPAPHAGFYYLVREAVAGENLSEMLDRGAPEPGLIASIMSQVVVGLDSLHGANIIHRDLRPHDIILTPAGRGNVDVKLTDPGLARLYAQSLQQPSASGPFDRAGIRPNHRAPEVWYGDESTVSADLYAVGAIFYQAATGREYGGMAEATMAAPAGAVQDLELQELGLPDGTAEAIQRCLADEPSMRPQSAREVLALLRPKRRKATQPQHAPRSHPATQEMVAMEQPTAIGQIPQDPPQAEAPVAQSPAEDVPTGKLPPQHNPFFVSESDEPTMAPGMYPLGGDETGVGSPPVPELEQTAPPAPSPIAKPVAAREQKRKRTQPPPVASFKPDSQKSGILPKIIIAVLALAIVGGGAFWFLNRPPETFPLDPTVRQVGEALEVIGQAPLDLGGEMAQQVAAQHAGKRYVAFVLSNVASSLSNNPAAKNLVGSLSTEQQWMDETGSEQNRAGAKVLETLASTLPRLTPKRSFSSDGSDGQTPGQYYLFSVARNQLDPAVQQLTQTQDAQGLVAGVAFPTRSNGYQTGVVMVGGEPAAPLTESGLQPGDIIKAIDGIPVQGTHHFKRLLENTVRDRKGSGGGTIPIDVVRGGNGKVEAVNLKVAG